MRRTIKATPLHVAVAHERRVAALLAVLLLLVCTDVFKVVMGGEFPEGQVKFAVTLVMVAFSLLRTRFLLRAAFGTPELAMLLILVLLSTLWSLDPVLTLERTFQLYATTALAMVLASMLSMRSLVLTLASAAGVIMLGSIIAIALVPSARGAEPWPDTWRGLFYHKNGLGAGSALALMLLAAAISISGGWPRRIFVALALLSLGLLIASESRTSQVIGMVSAFWIFIAAMSRNHLRIWMICFLFFFVLGFSAMVMILFSGIADPWFEAIGRRATLSNRIPLWEVVWPDAMKEIWTGYGYLAYWDPESVRVARIERIPFLGFIPHYSHNGLIELLLNVGILGPPLMLVAILRAMVGAYVALRVRGMRIAGASALVVLVAFWMFNFTESMILNRDSFGWFVFVAVATKLSLLLKVRSRRWLTVPVATLRRAPRRAVPRYWVTRAQ